MKTRAIFFIGLPAVTVLAFGSLTIPASSAPKLPATTTTSKTTTSKTTITTTSTTTIPARCLDPVYDPSIKVTGAEPPVVPLPGKGVAAPSTPKGIPDRAIKHKRKSAKAPLPVDQTKPPIKVVTDEESAAAEKAGKANAEKVYNANTIPPDPQVTAVLIGDKCPN